MSRDADSILLADIGNIWTRAWLLDKVGNEHRLVARSRARSVLGGPGSDVRVGLRAAFRTIEKYSGRRLTYEGGEPISPEGASGEGVDAVFITVSADCPFRLTLLGGESDQSVDLLRAALAELPVLLHDVIYLERVSTGRIEDAAGFLDHPPDLVLLTGTRPDLIYAGARLLAALFAGIEPNRRPATLYVGTPEALQQVADLLTGVADYVALGEDALKVRALQRELHDRYKRALLHYFPGMRAVNGWSTAPVRPSYESVRTLATALMTQRNLPRGVAVAYVDGASCTLAVIRDTERLIVRPDVGSELVPVAPVDLARWLPFTASEDEIAVRVANMRTRPASASVTSEDISVEAAMAREIVRRAAQDYANDAGHSFDLIVFGGPIVDAIGNPALLTLVALDALEPEGVGRLVLDRHGLLSSAGIWAAIDPAAAVDFLECDGFLDVGPVIAPLGRGKVGARALSVEWISAEGERKRENVAFGSIATIPVHTSAPISVDLRPSPRFDIGRAQRGWGGTVRLVGGELGLLIDARGRPLTWPSKGTQSLIQQWQTAVEMGCGDRLSWENK
ncbi:MAG: glutamate mutase L [Chloroflexi bacterium]|nr:glutamate mutase L [Chloroflexota bacterium]